MFPIPIMMYDLFLFNSNLYVIVVQELSTASRDINSFVCVNVNFLVSVVIFGCLNLKVFPVPAS